jgi:hypothetical protein
LSRLAAERGRNLAAVSANVTNIRFRLAERTSFITAVVDVAAEIVDEDDR